MNDDGGTPMIRRGVSVEAYEVPDAEDRVTAMREWVDKVQGEHSKWLTKDSGARAEYNSGMVRDTEDGKARFDLLLPHDVPYQAQLLTRFADLLTRGAIKYDARNWEKASGAEEMDRFVSSALRHMMQWATGETDEDHATAILFNVLAAETLKHKLGSNKENGSGTKEDGTAQDWPCTSEGCTYG